MKWNFVVGLAFLSLFGACSQQTPNTPKTQNPETTQTEIHFDLSFEERMSIRAKLTRLTAEAQREANLIYDPFKSREYAVLNEQKKIELELERHRILMDQYNLTPDDIDTIVHEYVTSQGVPLRR